MTPEAVIALAMVCLLGGTLLVGFSRPLWWMLHRRRPNGSRPEIPPGYVWLLRLSGALLLLAAAAVTAMSATGTFFFA